MTQRRLILFDVEGVLVEQGREHRPAGAAEGLARLRHESDAVLAVVTAEHREEALRKAHFVGVDRYLDPDVGAYGGESTDTSALVPVARDRARDAYGEAFTVVVVTAGPAAETARLRPVADLLVALAPAGADDPAAAGLREAGADHVVATLLDVADLASGVPAN
jgi:phosphoglycolate phosphatase-like HAD superfamily hydrolase